jgi:DNA mismatch repair protein MutS
MDLERLIGRISLKTASPRDMASLAKSLSPFPELERRLSECRSERGSGLAGQLAEQLPHLFRIRDLIDRAIVEAPPPSLSEGGVIREGYSPDLDAIRSISREGKGWITQLESKERARSGIESLKIRYNRVFGYYIEISRNRLKNVPPDYIRKQTLANAERFITPELKGYEDKVLGAEERCRDLEETLFEEVRNRVSMEVRWVQKAAAIAAETDVLAALSEAAHLYHYVKPEIHEGTALRISDGRHPLVERMSPVNGFVPNDTEMDCDDRQIMVLTGPNMAGKSTYMRQVALIVLMAQMGSFVPAREASIGLVDRIFTRIGASDNLVEGRSTFMVEMEESAEILQFATPRSLILLDEIGRGTSTFDGISIAWSVAEYLRRHNRAKTLFATHYHELTELALTEPGIFNMRMLVREWNEEVIFLKKLADGPADKSYGIQVARLAGLPETVIRRAREILANLDATELDESGVPRFSQPVDGDLQDRSRIDSQPQIPLFQPPPHPVLTELRMLDPMNMTPMEALSKLEELKRKVH